MPSGLTTSRQAPPSEILRTMQSMPAARLNAMVAALKTLCLGYFLCSIMVRLPLFPNIPAVVTGSGRDIAARYGGKLCPTIYEKILVIRETALTLVNDCGRPRVRTAKRPPFRAAFL